MGEKAFLIAGFVFLAALTPAMFRLGRGSGGPMWVAAWFCHPLGGVTAYLGSIYPGFSLLTPIFGTTFAACLFAGSVRFVQPGGPIPKWLAPTAAFVVLVRIGLQLFVGMAPSHAIGAMSIVSSSLGSCWIFLHPPGDRDPDQWERGLALGFPVTAVAAVYYAVTQISEASVPSAEFGWLLLGISLIVLKVSAFLARTAVKIRKLTSEANLSKDAQARLEAQYREVTDNASDLITEIDQNGVILYANPAHEVLLGYPLEALIGGEASELLKVGAASPIALANRPKAGAYQQRINVTRKDGVLCQLECNVRPFRLPTGELRIVITSRDITERVATEKVREEARKQLEALVDQRTEALRSSLDELQRSRRLASLGTLAAGVAHQINNPIGSIQMSAEFALLSDVEEAPNAEWREALENCRDEAQRCGRIVSNMLQFARNQPTEKSEEDLAIILKSVCEQMDAYSRDQFASIDSRDVAGPLRILGSAIDLEQALLNIIRNAAESSEGPVRIEVSTSQVGPDASVRIRDNGRGMTHADAERVFDPFYTTRLGKGGTGLGLSVAHGIVSDHGGKLKIQSEPGEGTIVELLLPLISSASDSTTAATPSSPAPALTR